MQRARPPISYTIFPLSLLRRSFLSAAGLLAAALSLSCGDSVLRGNGLARVVFEPRFSQEDAAIFKSLRTFNLGVTSLRVQLRRPDQSEVLAEQTVIVEDGASEIRVSLDVVIVGSEELLVASLEMHSGTVLIFSGSINVVARALANPTAVAPVLQLVWVGPGADAVHVVITPRDQNLSAINGRLALTATAYTAEQQPVTDPDFVSRFKWTLADPTLGTLQATGESVEFVAAGTAGVAIISILTPNLLRDTVRLSLQSVLPLARVRFVRQVEVLDRAATAAPVPVNATDPNGTPVTTATFAYLSRNAEVATVSASGAITGVSKGQTVIVVTAQEPGNSTIATDSLLAVVAEAGAPVVIGSVDRFEYARDALVTVSLFVDMRAGTQRLGSTTMDVTWNPEQLIFQERANGASGVTPTVNALSAPLGVLTLAMADVAGFAGLVELLRITFRTSASPALGQLTLTALELNAADFADLLGPAVQVSHPIAVP